MKTKLKSVDELQRRLVSKTFEKESWSSIMSCLIRTVDENNFRLCLKTLKCVTLMMEYDTNRFRSKISVWAKKMLGRMCDNKQAVREMATETAFRMIELYGTTFFYQHLAVPGFQHKKSKTREQISNLVSRLADRLVSENEISGHVLELVIEALEDSAKEVRESAIRAVVRLAPMYTDLNELIGVLEEYGVRSTQIAIVRNELGLQEEKDENTEITLKHRPSRNHDMGGGGSSSSSSLSNNNNITSKLYEISRVLKDTSADWELRRNELETLRDLALNSPDVLIHPSALDILSSTLKSCLQAQLKDLRSAIVGDACLTVEALAEALEHRFESLSRDLGDTLLQLSFVKKKPMREPADICMKTIVHSTQYGYKHLLSLFLERAMGSSRNGILRAATLKYLTLALLVWNRSIFVKREREIRKMLNSCLGDKNADARMRARQCFKAFEIHFPGQARMLRNEIGGSIQKQLDSTVLSCDFADRPTSSSSRTRPTSSNSSSNRSRPTSSSSSSSYCRPVKPKKTKKHQVPMMKQQQEDESPPKKKTKIRRAPLRQIQKDRQSSPVSSDITTKFSSGALRVKPRLEEESTSSSGDDEEEEEEGENEVKSQREQTKTHTTTKDILPHRDMSDLVAASTNSKSWSEREMALIEIHTIVENENTKIRASMWASIVEATCECLDDGHYRVVHAALDLIRLATTSYDKFDTCLDWILCVVFRLTASKKRETKERAVSTLQAIQDACDTSTMLSALTVSMSSRKANECLESLRFMIRTYTTNTSCEMSQHLKRLGVSAMKQLTVRLVNCMKHRSGQIQRSATKFVLFLRTLVGEEKWLTSVLMLSPATQSELVKSLQMKLPDLGTQIAVRARNSSSHVVLKNKKKGNRKKIVPSEEKKNVSVEVDSIVEKKEEKSTTTNIVEEKKTTVNTLSNIILKLNNNTDEDVILSLFQEILYFMRTGDKVEWSRCFRDVLEMLINSFSNSSTKVCERALFLMHQIVQSHSSRIETYVDSVMNALLQCTIHHKSESVTYCSRNTLFALCKRVDSKICLLSLVKYVREATTTQSDLNVTVLKTSFRLMMILIPRVSKLDLETWASGTLIGAANRALNHHSSEMRMVRFMFICAV